MMNQEENYYDDIDYGVEYCVYDVTPDVSIDFVSFTTEESEGMYQPCPDISEITGSNLYKHSTVICKAGNIAPAPVYKVSYENGNQIDTTSDTEDDRDTHDNGGGQFYSWSHTISDLRTHCTDWTKSPPPSFSLGHNSNYHQASNPAPPLQTALNNFKHATWRSRQELAKIYPESFKTIVQSLKSLRKKESHQTRREGDNDNQRREKYFSKLPRASSLSQAKNSEIEYKWKEISKSLANLKMSKCSKVSETDLNKSIDVLDFLENDLKEKENIRERCKSVFSISTSCNESIKNQIPENNLQNLNSFQARIQASVDKLMFLYGTKILLSNILLGQVFCPHQYHQHHHGGHPQ